MGNTNFGYVQMTTVARPGPDQIGVRGENFGKLELFAENNF